MGNEKVDLITVEKPAKRSLLEKYEIPIDHLSFEYITKCSDAKELQRIVIILRSGEEGIYPDLTRHAEERLAIVKPTSAILRKVEPVLTRSMLEVNEREEIDNDINNWMSEMRCREKDLDEGRATLKAEAALLPEVRHTKESTTKKQDGCVKDNSGKAKRIASCDYAAWDKYDADTEINRIDLRDERQQVEDREIQRRQKEIAERQNSQKMTVDKLSLTATELNVMAELEKNKGNEAFRAGDYVDALRLYTSSIMIDPSPITYNNRAITHIKLRRYEDAIDDCNIVLDADRLNIKTLLRRAFSLENLGEKHEALLDYETVLRIEPSEKTAIAGVKKLRKPSESKKVRMKIEEEVEQRNGETKMSDSKVVEAETVQLQADKGVGRSICCCDRAPGTSQRVEPWPHIKATYCLESKNENATTNVYVNGTTGTNERSSLRDTDLRSFKGSKKLSTTTASSARIKSIFSCAATTDRFTDNSSGVVIEEIPNEPYDEYSKLKKSGTSESKDTLANDKHDVCIKDKKSIIRRDKEVDDKVARSPNTESKEESHLSSERKEVKKKNVLLCERLDKDISNIGTPYEFFRVWQSIEDDKDLKLHAKLLRPLASKDFNKGNKLDGSMFSLILRCLEKHFTAPHDRNLLVHFLKSLSQLNRFSIVKMFMDSNDKTVLENIFRLLEEEKSPETPTLRQLYI